MSSRVSEALWKPPRVISIAVTSNTIPTLLLSYSTSNCIFYPFRNSLAWYQDPPPSLPLPQILVPIYTYTKHWMLSILLVVFNFSQDSSRPFVEYSVSQFSLQQLWAPETNRFEWISWYGKCSRVNRLKYLGICTLWVKWKLWKKFIFRGDARQEVKNQFSCLVSH